MNLLLTPCHAVEHLTFLPRLKARSYWIPQPPPSLSTWIITSTKNELGTYTIKPHLICIHVLILSDHNNDPFSLISPIRRSTLARYWIHDDGELVQTEENRGSKADAADVFIMTQSIVKTRLSVHARSTWRLCSKEEPHQSNWITKYFRKSIPEKVKKNSSCHCLYL